VQSAAATIRAISATDHAVWLDMWNAYCAFYDVDIPERVTESTWQRIIANDVPVHALIAVSGSTGAALGFANYVVHPFTWSERPACYLEDLFVYAGVRGSGIGRALLERLIALAEQHQWARIYWLTRENNAVARRLYDRFCQADDFVHYVVTLDIALHKW